MPEKNHKFVEIEVPEVHNEYIKIISIYHISVSGDVITSMALLIIACIQ